MCGVVVGTQPGNHWVRPGFSPTPSLLQMGKLRPEQGPVSQGHAKTPAPLPFPGPPSP